MKVGPISRNSPVPLYLQLRQAVLEAVEAGELREGQALPSEEELCRQFDVSRIVVRQALRDLAREGVLVRQRGRGTFVRRKTLIWQVQRVPSFFQEMRAQGHTVRNRILAQRLESPTDEIREKLGLGPGIASIRIERLRMVDGLPVVYDLIHLPADLCPDLEKRDLTQASLFQVLEQEYGLRVHRGKRVLEGAVASPEIARLLRIQPGWAVLKLTGMTQLRSGRTLEVFAEIHRADWSKVELELTEV